MKCGRTFCRCALLTWLDQGGQERRLASNLTALHTHEGNGYRLCLLKEAATA